MDVRRRVGPLDGGTAAAIAVLAYAAANVLHEGLGHGGACVLVGGVPRLLTSVSFTCDTAALSTTANHVVSAGGTIVNLIAGSISLAVFRRRHAAGNPALFGSWLFAAINLLQGVGYLFFSGVGNVGDWASVMENVRPQWLWRIALGGGGLALYWLIVARLYAMLAPALGFSAAERYARGNKLSVIAYITGGLLYCVSGVLNPAGVQLLLISAAAASFGGTSGLAWGPQLLRGVEITGDDATLVLKRSPRLLAAAAVAIGLFVFVLGPGIAF